MPPYRVPDQVPANDNEHPDDSWRRAELILSAYSGSDLATADEQKQAIAQLLTDVMHYCEVMSLGKRSDHPDYLDFDDIHDTAFAHYEEQSHSMNSVMEMEGKRTADLVGQRLAELKAARNAPDVSEIHNELQILEHIEQKGPLTEWERRRRDELNETLNAEPELKKILVDLDTRQRKEANALGDAQDVERREGGLVPDILARHERQNTEQYERFSEERARHIRQYQNAKNILAGVSEPSQQEGMRQDRDDDPKITR